MTMKHLNRVMHGLALDRHQNQRRCRFLLMTTNCVDIERFWSSIILLLITWMWITEVLVKWFLTEITIVAVVWSLVMLFLWFVVAVVTVLLIVLVWRLTSVLIWIYFVLTTTFSCVMLKTVTNVAITVESSERTRIIVSCMRIDAINVGEIWLSGYFLLVIWI